jgi:hypothetical protein
MESFHNFRFLSKGILPIDRGQNFANITFVLIAFIILYVLYVRFFGPLAKIPGPFFASLSRLWMVHVSRKGNIHRIMLRLHEKAR